MLYQVELQMLREDEVIDDLIERFGFREICVQGKYILLNGKRLRSREYAVMRIIRIMDVRYRIRQYIMIWF